MKKTRLIKEYQKFIEDYEFNDSPDAAVAQEEPEAAFGGEETPEEEHDETAEVVNQIMSAIQEHGTDTEALEAAITGIVTSFHAHEEHEAAEEAEECATCCEGCPCGSEGCDCGPNCSCCGSEDMGAEGEENVMNQEGSEDGITRVAA